MKTSSLRTTLFLGGVSLGAVFLPILLMKAGIIDAYAAQVITLGGINAIMALSVNTITGVTGQLSLGQAGFMAIGAYACISLSLDAGLPIPLSIILAMLISALAGFLIGFPTLKLSGDYLAIVTLGFGEIIRVIFINTKALTGGAGGRKFTTPVSLEPDLAFGIVTASLIAVLILLQNFLRSSYGRAILAIREDEIAANANGISVFRYKMTGFVIASLIAGLGGSLYALVLGFVKPDVGAFLRSVDYLIFVVLGGMGSMTGSILAAYVLTSLQEFLRFFQDYRLVIYPVILILVMLFRPQGLLGMREFSFTGLLEKLRRPRAGKAAGSGAGGGKAGPHG
ncbi:MAG: branched-chain amino acid ABC transporter permease [Spirochaetaceae bacterium]|jgi:branched-chain amino acid transport system permease protein|nr:branched-chain amino acid ABC transporter permease [Spirochaetaceae bacterium]